MLREFASVSVKNATTLSDLGYAYTTLMNAVKLPLSGLTSCFFLSVVTSNRPLFVEDGRTLHMRVSVLLFSRNENALTV